MPKIARLAFTALTTAGVVAGALRLRRSSSVPTTGGGWRELSGPDLR